jgi:hypothetical protein
MGCAAKQILARPGLRQQAHAKSPEDDDDDFFTSRTQPVPQKYCSCLSVLSVVHHLKGVPLSYSDSRCIALRQLRILCCWTHLSLPNPDHPTPRSQPCTAHSEARAGSNSQSGPTISILHAWGHYNHSTPGRSPQLATMKTFLLTFVSFILSATLSTAWPWSGPMENIDALVLRRQNSQSSGALNTINRRKYHADRWAIRILILVTIRLK